MGFMREVRTQAGQTLSELAKATGSSESYLSLIEAGRRRPSVPMAKKLAAALGTEWTKFFEEE